MAVYLKTGQRLMQQRLSLHRRLQTAAVVRPVAQERRLAPVIAASAADEEKRAFPCVRLRGLPFDVSEDEVATFLGCEPVDVFCVNRQGRFTGEAFVVLCNEQQVAAAMDKDKGYVGKRYVEVFRARKAEYYRAIGAEVYGERQYSQGRSTSRPAARAGSGPGSSDEASCSNIVRLRGLPYSAQKEDIVQWFEDVAPLTADNVRIITDSGRPTGAALVQFASPQDAQSAAAAKHKQMMGPRYIEVFTSSSDELQRYLPRSY